jgi:hypothetical protein
VSRLFDLFTSILDVVLHNARREGQLDSGIVDIKAKNVEMKEPPKVMLLADHFLGGSTVNSKLISKSWCRPFILIACLALQQYCLLSPLIGELLGR